MWNSGCGQETARWSYVGECNSVGRYFRYGEVSEWLCGNVGAMWPCWK